MRILVLGAGSIGIYLGCLLKKSGHEVTLLGRHKLRKIPNTILIGEKIYSVPKKIYSLKKNDSFDLIFITSKLYDLKKNLKLIKQKNVLSTYLVSIQNGIVEKEVYSPYIGDTSFTSISVFEGYRVVDNQLFVSQSEMGWKTDDSLAGKFVSDLLKSAGINCGSSSNLETIKAEKTIMNCSVNLLSAVEKKTFFELYHNPETKRIMDELFDESYSVLSKKYELEPKGELKKLFYDIISPMKHYSSTYQDAVSGRKTEIDFLNKLIIKLGKESKISTPENSIIVKRFERMYS